MMDGEKMTKNTNCSSILCSICLDEVADDLNRSISKLQCGHHFHLDCIGSAFNMKGAMQCPNCRQVERGRWLYATGPTRSVPELSMDDWTLHEDQYGLSYPEIPLNVHWCPFSGLARVHSAFEALESLPPAYRNLHRHHNMFAEHGAAAAASSVAHSYVAYFGPIPPASANINETIDDPNLSYHWNGISNTHGFPAPDIHYHNGVHHSHLLGNNPHGNSTDQVFPVAPVTLRSARGDFGAMTRSGPYMPPFLYGHGSRSHERLQPSHAMHHPHQPTSLFPITPASVPGMTRFSGRRALPQTSTIANSLSDHNGGFFMVPHGGSSVPISRETENPLPVISSDRNSGWSSFHNGAGSDTNRTGNFWHRHWS